MYGVDLQVKAAGKRGKAAVAAQRQALLFTHRGFSGPAVLDLSHHAVRALDRAAPLPGALPAYTSMSNNYCASLQLLCSLRAIVSGLSLPGAQAPASEHWCVVWLARRDPNPPQTARCSP